jgi:uncharacterized membrane protein YesL
MHNIFNLDSPILRALATAFDFAVLSLVTLLLCVPVITAGAAVTALYRVILSWLDHSNESLSALRLVREWAACLKKATLPWIGFLAAAMFLLLDIRVIGYMPEAARGMLAGIAILLLALVLLTGSFFFPQLARMPQMKLRYLLKRSFRFSVGLLPRCLPLALAWLVPGAMLLFFPKVFIILTVLWLCGWPSLCALLGGKLLLPYLETAE